MVDASGVVNNLLPVREIETFLFFNLINFTAAFLSNLFGIVEKIFITLVLRF